MNPHVQRVIDSLQSGKITAHTGFGNSMRPIILSGQKQILVPVLFDKEATKLGCKLFDPNDVYKIGDLRYINPDSLTEGDPVFCKVGGNIYTHKIRAIRGVDREFQISRQDEKRINGWTRIIYGRCARTE